MLKVIKKIAGFSGLPSLLPGSETELVVILVDDGQITKINEYYLQHEGPTDVIAFDYIKDFTITELSPYDPYTIGELYISLDTAARQAKEHDQSLSDELLLYITHGILHLCGYDDHCDKTIKKMRHAEKTILNKVKKELGTLNLV